MEIKVIGTGCASCKRLLGLVQEAVKELGMEADVKYITDMAEIMQTGIMQMPGLIVNGKVKAKGRVPSLNELKQIIQEEM